MKYYICGNIGGNKYRVEARREGADSELMGIYDGYYNIRSNLFSLYRRTVSFNVQPWELPEKAKISAFEVRQKTAPPRDAARTASAERMPERYEAPSIRRKRLPKDVDGQIKIG